jgi:hypothetical protein
VSDANECAVASMGFRKKYRDKTSTTDDVLPLHHCQQLLQDQCCYGQVGPHCCPPIVRSCYEMLHPCRHKLQLIGQ